MLKKIKNKKSQFFVILDLYSVAFLAAALLLLLLFITITGNRTSAKIDENILGMNYAHFFINNFNNEVIELPNCPELLQKTTRKDFLLWIDANRDYFRENLDKFGYTLTDIYSGCLYDFSRTFSQFETENEEIKGIMVNINIDNFEFSRSLNYYKEQYLNTKNFKFKLPSKEGNIEIEIRYSEDGMFNPGI
jgi:hypothetical protein